MSKQSLEKPSIVEQWKMSKDGKEVIAEVKLANLKLNGVVAFTRHTMVQVLELDRFRRNLTDDPHEQLLLAGMQQNFLQKAQGLHQGLFNVWDL